MGVMSVLYGTIQSTPELIVAGAAVGIPECC